MKPRRFASPLAALALFASTISPLARAADAPLGVDWVSNDALVHVESARPTLLLDRFLSPSFQAYLGAIPQYKRYIESAEFKQQSAQIEFVATLLDTTWERAIRDLAGGGLILSAEVVDGKPAVTLILTPSDPAFLAKAHTKLLDLARADAKGKGNPDPIKTADHRGITGYSVSSEEAHAIVRDALVITNSPKHLKTVIDRALDGKPGGAPPRELTDRRIQAKSNTDTIAWGLVRLEKLRALDPKFAIPEKIDPGATFLFGPWLEAARKAPWASAAIRWGDVAMTAEVELPAPRDGYSDTYRRYLPKPGQGAPQLLAPKGVIGNFSLWRDLASIWEVRAEIFPPEALQGLAQLDSFAGQFFGGREFGSGVLASLGTNWRLVVAEQDYAKMSPVPDIKLPAFALVIDTAPDDEEFAQRLRVAFQSFVGLANLGAAQEKAPPLESGSETVDGVTILTTHFLSPKAPAAKPGEPAAQPEPVHQRHNFTPSAMQVGNTFVLSSSIGLARDLVPLLKTPAKSMTETAILDVDGRALARLVEINKSRLVMQNMLEKGNDRAKAESEIGFLEAVLRYFSHATMTASDANESLRFFLKVDLGTAK
ncbi:MAG: hypothetical protein SFX72_14480 [Isosphaeraceae bacterium]|nr:hypothetical protein [Isosphaeraceae bacterium]